MNIICQTRPKVKPTRNTPRPATRFGSAILPCRPVYRAPASHDDMAWAAREFNAEVNASDRDYDVMAREAYAQDRLERGLLL